MNGRKVLLPPRQNECNPEPDTVFSVARAIMTSKGQVLGLLEVQQKFSIIEDIVSPYFGTWITIVTDNQGKLIYPLDISGLNEELKAVLSNANNNVQLILTAYQKLILFQITIQNTPAGILWFSGLNERYLKLLLFCFSFPFILSLFSFYLCLPR